MPSEFASPRLSSILSSSLGSCSERPTSTAPGIVFIFSMKSPVIAISLRESGPENWICTGFLTPLFRSSSTTYSAPTSCETLSRSSAAISKEERSRVFGLPMST